MVEGIRGRDTAARRRIWSKEEGMSTDQSGTAEASGAAPIRILVIADTRLYREGLAEVLGRDRSLDVVAVVPHAVDAVMVIAEQPIDVVLLGVTPQNAFDATRTISAAHPGTRVVALAV